MSDSDVTTVPSEEELADAVRAAWRDLNALERQLTTAMRRRNQLPVDLATATEPETREKLRAERVELDEAIEVTPLHVRGAAAQLIEAFIAYAEARHRVAQARYSRFIVQRPGVQEYLKEIQEFKQRFDHLETRLGLDRTRATSLTARAKDATPETIVHVLENYFPMRLIPDQEIVEVLQVPAPPTLELGEGDDDEQ